MTKQNTKEKEVKPTTTKVEEQQMPSPEKGIEVKEQQMPSQEEIIKAMSEALIERDNRISLLSAELERLKEEKHCSENSKIATADPIDEYLSHQLAYQEKVMDEAKHELELKAEEKRKYYYEHGEYYRPEPCRCDEGWAKIYDETECKIIFLKELLRRYRNGL